MSNTNGPNKNGSLLTNLESYINFCTKTEKIINSFDDRIVEIYDLDKDLTKILEVVKMQKLPGLELTEQSIYAQILSIMTNARANKTHFICLKAQIRGLDGFLSICS